MAGSSFAAVIVKWPPGLLNARHSVSVESGTEGEPSDRLVSLFFRLITITLINVYSDLAIDAFAARLISGKWVLNKSASFR